MSASISHCPHCGSFLEADCDFCPNCGTPKERPQVYSIPQPAAHSWMGETSHRNPVVQGNPLAVSPNATQVAYAPYAVPNSIQAQDSSAATAKTMGIVAISLMVVGLIPCLGWLNYINLILGFITLIISIVALSNAKSAAARSAATIGMVFALVAGFVGFIRLILGGGCL
jgi:hypothetical protein